MKNSIWSSLHSSRLKVDLSEYESSWFSWQSPSNIALVKYWGKKNGQYPATPSLSMTLAKAHTQTKIAIRVTGSSGVYSVNGDNAHPFLPKLNKLFNFLAGEFPALQGITVEVETQNNFPHSTGIASSASGISAFSLSMLDFLCHLHGCEIQTSDFLKLASFISREGSGSACRSVYGGFAVWGQSPEVYGSSDEYAISVAEKVHPSLNSLKDAILVISREPKSMPSTVGHNLMSQHPFLPGRTIQANRNLKELMEAMVKGDLDQIADITENEALTLHALMMSALPGTLLMKPATIEVISQIRQARKNGLPVFFTMDAGANVHLLYPANANEAVNQFIMDELKTFCDDGWIIFDHCGAGPSSLKNG